MLVVENSVGSKLLCEQSLLPRSYFLFPGDQQDGTRVCMVFRDGIKAGRSNIATCKMEFVLRPYLLRREVPENFET